MRMLHVISVVVCIFFFFKQKTAYEMRISDWSSDVCSSDLPLRRDRYVLHADLLAVVDGRRTAQGQQQHRGHTRLRTADPARDPRLVVEIGRASCRERVCQYV